MRQFMRSIIGTGMLMIAFAIGGCETTSHKEVRTYEYHGDPARRHETAEPVSEEYQMQSPGEMVSPGEMQSPGKPVVDPGR